MAIQSRDQVEVSAVRRFAPVLAALVGIGIVAVGVVILLDRNASSNLLASIYDLIGNTQAAADLRAGVGDQLIAKLVLAGLALVVGVGGIWMVFIGASAVVGLLSPRWQGRVLPWVFVIPAMVLLTVYLVYPTIGTIITSFTVQTDGDPLANYKQLTSPLFLDIIRNNIIWLIVGTGGTVLLGLLFAALFDRVRRESLAKTFIFLPLAISFVGASVIWRFVYEWKPAGKPQIGTVNAVWTAFGLDPVRWVQQQPINTFALIFIFIWLQTGFAMVVLSAAIKGSRLRSSRRPALTGHRSVSSSSSDRAHHQGLDHHGRHDDRDRRPEGLRHRLCDDRWPQRHRRDREPDVPGDVPVLQRRTCRGAGTLLFIAVLPVMFVNVRNMRRQGVGA